MLKVTAFIAGLLFGLGLLLAGMANPSKVLAFLDLAGAWDPSLALVMGGAIGNVIDRVRFGAVVDFIQWHAAGFYWPAFNIADSAITVGAILLVFAQLTGAPHQEKTR